MERFDPTELLQELRDATSPDRKFMTDFGEHVWLTKCPGGVTDCCLVSEPCDYHASLTHEAPAAKQ
jgi:hypothetical protein